MSVKVVFDIGHIASLKSKITPEGFTHDWELYVRGCDSADISHYIDKVVFNLHESFPKPKRVFKEPPYSLKESGYAGFVLPIDIYFKNRDDPKKITCSYDLNLQNTGTITNVDKKTQLFKSPSEDFRRKLLKGGGFTVNNFPNNADEKAREQDERAQLISKPKLGGSELGGGGKKYKSKSDETKVSNTYANLFGPSGSKGAAKVSPDAKNKSASSTGGAKQPQKTEKTSRDKSEKEKKEKNKHNSPNKEKPDGRDVTRKPPQHDDKHEKREEKKKDKTHSKERGRSKDKVSNVKQDPSPKRMTTQSPKRVSPSRSASALSKADDTQSSVKSFSKQAEPNDRPSSSAKKPKKDKKEKNPDKERERERAKDQKQKEERPSSKVSDKIDLKKEKDPVVNRNQKEKAKVNDVKQATPVDHISEPLTATPNDKKAEKDPDRKHKHKKKDKNKDKEKEHAKERKKEKSSKYKEDVKMAQTSPPKKSELPQASQLPQQQQQQPTKVNPLTALLNEIDEKASSDSDDDHSKPSISYTQAIPSAKLLDSLPPKPSDDPQQQPTKSEKQLDKGERPPKRAKKEKEAKSSDKEDKKRKRKSKDETPSPAFSEPPVKQSKKEENGALSWRSETFMSTSQNTPPPHRIDAAAISRSSPSLPIVQKSTPSSSLRATPSPLSTNTAHHQLSPNLQQQQRQQKDYMSQLKELQHKIMSLEDNNELQQVVEMIIETGNYEITGEKTFDFDLCALDRTTVQRLQTFFATSCWL